jgi:hypothetical protein
MVQHEDSFGRKNDMVADLSQRLDAFRPLPFNAATDARRIHGAHWINLAEFATFFIDHLLHYIGAGFAFASPAHRYPPVRSHREYRRARRIFTFRSAPALSSFRPFANHLDGPLMRDAAQRFWRCQLQSFGQ